MARRIEQLSLETRQLLLEYGEAGQARLGQAPILWVHGLGAQWRQFELQLQHFGATHWCLAPSLRGHGATVQQAAATAMDLSVLADDLLAFLEALHVPQVHYVGNSMGGNLGFELLRRAPERLLSLTTFGTTARLHQPAWLVGLLKGLYRILPPSWIARLSSASGQTSEAKATIYELLKSVRRETVLQLMPELAQLDYLEVLSASTVPWLLVQGAADRDINRVLDETLGVHGRGGLHQLVQLDGAGHFANLDQPIAFNQAVADFLKRFH